MVIFGKQAMPASLPTFLKYHLAGFDPTHYNVVTSHYRLSPTR